MPFEGIRGFTNLDTSKNPKHLRIDQIAFSHNLEWISDKEIYTRRGSTVYRDGTQWTGTYVIDAVTFKRRTDAFYFEIYFLANGTMFYFKSNAVDFTDSDGVATEITASDGESSPALAVNTKVSYDGINNKLIIVDGSSNIYWFDGTDDQVHLVADPIRFTLTYTISSATTVINDTYKDAADATRTFIVSSGATSSTSATLRQTGGETRTAASGTLTRLTGTGAASLTFTAYAGSDTYEELKLYKRKAFVISNEGNVDASINRNGTNFTGAGSGFMEIDVIEGFKVSNFIPFKRGAVITTEDRDLEKFSISTLTGYKFFDAAVAGSEVGQFKVERESKLHGFVGRSGQEIGNLIIGLTRNGFVAFGGAVSAEFGLLDQGSISDPIKDQIANVNFEAADQIFSVIDVVNQRYYCACPLFTDTGASTIFAYDYARSRDDGHHRWSVWSTGFGDIKAIFNFKNKVYLADENGLVYQFLVDGIYSDNSLAYASRFESASFSANSTMVDKDLKNVYIDFLIPDTEQEVQVYTKLDGHLISTLPNGNAIQKLKLTPRVSNNNIVSDFTFVDHQTIIGANTLSDVQIKHSSLGGRTQSEQIVIASSGIDINWGISGIMLELAVRDKARGQ